SRHYYLPKLGEPKAFGNLPSLTASVKIIFAERGGRSLKPALAGSPVLYLIGAEGGWTDEELTAAGKNGFQPVSLGAALLKAETAAIIGAALIRYEFDSSGG